MATLVGHESDELIPELARDPEAKMTRTDSVNAYLLRRNHLDPLPDYLKGLAPNVYNRVAVEEKTYQFTIIDLKDDRLYLAFDTTDISKLGAILLILLVAGGLLSSFAETKWRSMLKNNNSRSGSRLA